MGGSLSTFCKAAARHTWPQRVLTILPLLLFFPTGIVYLGVVVFLLSLMLAGDYRNAWLRMRANPMFWPIIALSAVSCLAGIFLERPAEKFWSSFAHYQIYLFLLLFLSVSSGSWQARSLKYFYFAALVAASLFYLNILGVLPELSLFNAYRNYHGNKSILLGILLAIAAAWLLYDITCTNERKLRWWRLAAFVYISIPVLFLTTTRTAVIIFALLCLMVSCKYVKWNWRSAVGFVSLFVIFALALNASATFKSRMASSIDDVMAYSQGKKPSHQSIRLEIYALTGEIIAKKPFTGHGIGVWEARYTELAKLHATDVFATPHNDYLLYAAEMGVLGLAALLWIWLTQLVVGWRMGEGNGMRLIMLGMSMMVIGMFNAVLRDGVFGMAFMILLALLLAGVQRKIPLKS